MVNQMSTNRLSHGDQNSSECRSKVGWFIVDRSLFKKFLALRVSHQPVEDCAHAAGILGRNFGAGILGGNFGLDFWAGIWGRRFRLGAASFDQVRQGSPKVRMPLNRLNRSLSNLVDPCRTLSTRDAPCRPLSHRTEFSKISSYRFTKPSWVRPHVLIPWRI